jgi:hypothetical protein
MDPTLAIEVIEKKVRSGKIPKALVLVHLYGQSADILPIKACCDKHGIKLIEDAAEALRCNLQWRYTRLDGLGRFFITSSYWMITSYYSISGKRVPILDVFILAGLYTFRAFAGSLTIDSGMSEWMAVFLLFLFLGLACLKRFFRVDKFTSPRKRTNRRSGLYQRGLIFNRSTGYRLRLCLSTGSLSLCYKFFSKNTLYKTILFNINCTISVFWFGSFLASSLEGKIT